MNTANIEQAKLHMKKLEELRVQEKELKKSIPYLPEKYDEKSVKQTINELDNGIEKLSEIKEKIELLNQNGESLDQIDGYDKLDDIISSIEQLVTKRTNFEKYKKLNDSMEAIFTEAVLSISNSRGDLFSSIFEDSLANNVSISSFVNAECLRNDSIKKPFMVALLTMHPDMIYETIINGAYSFTDEQKIKIRDYILFQKNRIDKNLVLSDKSLINLLESNTGRNIMEQEHINSKNKYQNYCEQFSYEIFGKSIIEQLLMSTPEYVFNAFNDLSQSFKGLSNVDKHRIKQHLEYLKNQGIYEQIQNANAIGDTATVQALRSGLNYHMGVLDSSSDRYNVIDRRSNSFYSLTGGRIKRFSSSYADQFTRTIDDMRIANFPTADVENYVFECFSSNRISNDVKQQLIAVALDNLELCYNLFNSYYKTGNKAGNIDLTTYLNMSNGNQIELNYKLEENNVPHILGIPASHTLDNDRNIIGLNLPTETLRILELSENNFSSAKEVLERILAKKNDIINSLGCFTGEDGGLYEMLPWEKIILKTNAFIRGDFFKTTSFISGINPDSYLISPNAEKDKVNAVALNSTYFGESAVNQQVPNIHETSPLIIGGTFQRGRNSLLQKNKDLILKGLIAQFDHDRISRIKGVQTNESFIGERLIKKDGIPIKTMNKPSYLLEGANPNSSGIVTSVENPIGYREYSIDELVLLLEDMTLSFENNQSVMDMVYTTIQQIEELNNSKKKGHKF